MGGAASVVSRDPQVDIESAFSSSAQEILHLLKEVRHKLDRVERIYIKLYI